LSSEGECAYNPRLRQIWLQLAIETVPKALQSLSQSLKLVLLQTTGHTTTPNTGSILLQLAKQVGVGGLVGAAIVGEAMFANAAKVKSAASASDLRTLHRLLIFVFIFPPIIVTFPKKLSPFG
jgi:hypothetical protein